MVGGDGFLEMAVEPGHEVVVEGYDGEPYLRFRADGTVQENQNSPAAYLNRNRYAGAEVPAAIAGRRPPPPAWKTVAHGGHHAWHDHRIHFMGKRPLRVAGLSEGEPVEWSGGVPFTVDGEDRWCPRQLPAARPAEPVALDRPDGAVVDRRNRRRRPAPAGARGRRARLLVGGDGRARASAGRRTPAIPEGAGATPLTVVLPTWRS